MGEVSTIGLDIAKSVFQVHGVDVAGSVVIRKRVSRAKVLEYFGELPRCLVGIEACPPAHHWGRELQALGGERSSCLVELDTLGGISSHLSKTTPMSSRHLHASWHFPTVRKSSNVM